MEKFRMETTMAEDAMSGGTGTVRPGTTAEDLANCAEGMHSWTGEVGLLPPDTECTHCGETYGHPE